MLKKILIGGAASLGAALVISVVREMQKEWDAMVDDYNDLVDRYNENVSFIQDCDFYNYKNPKSNDEKCRFATESEEVSDGLKRTVKKDKATGFSVLSYERA